MVTKHEKEDTQGGRHVRAKWMIPMWHFWLASFFLAWPLNHKIHFCKLEIWMYKVVYDKTMFLLLILGKSLIEYKVVAHWPIPILSVVSTGEYVPPFSYKDKTHISQEMSVNVCGFIFYISISSQVHKSHVNGLENKLLCLGLPSVVRGSIYKRHNEQTTAF